MHRVRIRERERQPSNIELSASELIESIHAIDTAPVYDVASPTRVQWQGYVGRMNNRWLAREDEQSIRSFKLRGAYLYLWHVAKEGDFEEQMALSRGVVAASAGNHAQGVALAAQTLEACGPATIFMPKNTPACKIERVEGLDANVRLVDGCFDDAQIAATRFASYNQLAYAHPFDNKYVMAGQGTLGPEILAKVPDADRLFIPLGGGGLLGGIAARAKIINPNTKIYGVQLHGANSLSDGTAVKQRGKLNNTIINSGLVQGIITVSNAELGAAVCNQTDQIGVLAETAGCLSWAGMQQFAQQNQDLCYENWVGIVSGGNYDMQRIDTLVDAWQFERQRSQKLGGRSLKIASGYQW